MSRFASQFSKSPVMVTLVVINAAVFLLQQYLIPHGTALMVRLFGLSLPDLVHGQFWRLITHQFIHGSLLHLLFNMMALWFAGVVVEMALGSRRFLTIYLISGIVGGLTQMVFNLHPPYVDLIGASGAVCGILMVFCTLFPQAEITALIFFIIPLRLRARTLGISIVVFSIVFWLSGWESNIGHLAHLGGFLTGFLGGLWYRKDVRDPNLFNVSAMPPPLPKDYHFHQSPQTDFDKVLDKVLQSGFESLTQKERRTLEEGRERFLKNPDSTENLS